MFTTIKKKLKRYKKFITINFVAYDLSVKGDSKCYIVEGLIPYIRHSYYEGKIDGKKTPSKQFHSF